MALSVAGVACHMGRSSGRGGVAQVGDHYAVFGEPTVNRFAVDAAAPAQFNHIAVAVPQQLR